MKMDTSILQNLRAQLIDEHQRDLAAVDHLLARAGAAVVAPIVPTGKKLHVDEVIARHKQRRAVKAAKNGGGHPKEKRPFGWINTLVKEFCAGQAGKFTADEVKQHVLAAAPYASRVQVYGVTGILLALRDRGLVDREGVGRQSVWRKTGTWTADGGTAERESASSRYSDFRSKLSIKTPAE